MTFTPTTHIQPFHFDPSLSADASGVPRVERPVTRSVDVEDADSIQLRFGAFRFELASERLWCGVREVPLKPKMRDMLVFFIRNPERLISKIELLTAIWGETHVSPETLRSSLRELRNVLEDDARMPRFVETVHGRGYRFVCPVVAENKGTTRPATRPTPTCLPKVAPVPQSSAVEGPALGFEPDDSQTSDPRVRQIAEKLRGLAEHPDAREIADALAECADRLVEVAEGQPAGATVNGAG